MPNLNKVMLMGHLGTDPEMRFTPNGPAVASFRMAVTEKYKDKNTGQMQESTEWVSVVIWGKMAETSNKYLQKGSPVFIEGKLKTRSWEGNDGQKKYKTEVVATRMQFLGGNSGGGSRGSGSGINNGESSWGEDDLPF